MDQEEQAGRPDPQLTAARGPGGAPARQRGWAGILALLLAVLIVSVLAGALLKQYGTPGALHARVARDPVDAAATEPGTGSVDGGNEGSAAAPRNPVERARAVEETVRKSTADI